MRVSFSRVARYGGGALVVAFAIAYFVWRPLAVSGPPMGDFSAYYAAGATWAHGGDPYGTDVWTVERTLPGVDPHTYALLPYVGPPLGLPVWAALARLPYRDAVTIWGIVLAFCIGAIFVIPAKLAGRRLRAADAVALVVLASASGPLVDGIALGQAALPASAAVFAAILAAARARWIWVGVWAVVAVVFKPNLAFALAATVRAGGALAALIAGAVASALGTVTTIGGMHPALAYLHLLPEMTASERFYAYQFTPTAIAYGFGATQRTATIAGDAVALAAIAGVVLAIRWSRASLADGAAIACAALPLAVPYVHEPDFAIAYLPALLIVYRARGWAWIAGTCGFVLLAVDAYALAQGRAGLAFSLITAAVAAAEIAAVTRTVPRAYRFAPLAIAALVLGVGLAAPRSTLPMWPASLPRHFWTPSTSANEVWRRELVASGLENERPWAALLRSLTLSGCVLIAVAMTQTARRTAQMSKESA